MTEILNRLITETGCTKNQAISALIARLVADGATVRGAVDAVLGDGTFGAVAGNAYNNLRSEG